MRRRRPPGPWVLAFGLWALAPGAGAQPPPEVPVELPPPPGEAPTVESVRLEGVRIGRRTPLREKIRLDLDAPLDEAAIEDTRIRLLATGLCEAVRVRLDRGGARGRVVVVFTCDERVTTSLDAFHLGSARPTRFWAGAELSDLDPFGVGVGFGVGLVASGDQLSTRLATRLPAPWVGDASLRVALRYLDGRERFVGPLGQTLDGEEVVSIPVDYRRAGLDLGLQLDLRPFLRMTVGLSGEWVQAEPPAGAEAIDLGGRAAAFDFALDPDQPVSVLVPASLVWDDRDDPAFPTRGTRAALTARAGWYDGPWGALAGRIEQYIPIPGGSTVRLDAFLGGLVGGAPFFARYFVGDLHPYIPARAMGLNFSHRRGPTLLDLDRAGDLGAARYEPLALRLGTEYRLPLGAGPHREPYGVEFFVGAGLVSMADPAALGGLDGLPPLDLAVDVGLRFETEIGVMGLSVGNLFLLVEP